MSSKQKWQHTAKAVTPQESYPPLDRLTNDHYKIICEKLTADNTVRIFRVVNHTPKYCPHCGTRLNRDIREYALD